MGKCLLAVTLFGAMTTAAGAIDMKELQPCKPAASRYCDNADITATMSNLLRCGATLASVQEHVGERCREVLRRYGQLNQ